MNAFFKLSARIALAISGGVPLLLMGYALILVWVDPLGIDQGTWLKFAATVVLFEFFLLHSGAFMAAAPIISRKWWHRLAWFFGFGLVYLGAMIGFAIAVKGQYVFWVILGVSLSRLMALVVIPEKRGVIMMLQRSALGMMVLILTFAICFIPWPSLGITEEIRHATFGVAEDILSEYPQRLIAWGVVYFFIMSIFEFYAGWNLPDWSDEQVEETWKALKQ